MASFSRRLLISALAALFSLVSVGAGNGNRDCYIERIINLGDSISDTGNLLRQGGPFATIIKNLPYGQSIPEGPTGRCSDGLLIIDHIAEGLGVSRLAAYLDKSAKFDHGVNFAVAGATALNSSCLGEMGIQLPYTQTSLEVQETWFNEYLSAICPSHPDCSDLFEKTLFLVGEIGGNDYNFALTQNKPIYEVRVLVPLVVKMIINTAQNLINNGARNLIIPGNFAIGCLPSYLTLFGNTSTLDESGCVMELNNFAKFHNDYLEFSIKKLTWQNPNVSIAYADYFNPLIDMIRNPSAYGFGEESKVQACCGAGGAYNFDMAQMCGMGVPICSDPGKFISWDGVHLTQAAYRVIANQLFSNVEILKQWKCKDS